MSKAHEPKLEGFNEVTITRMLLPDIDTELEAVAGEVAEEARASTLFKDSKKTKNKLRRSISVRKSKYEFGGWLVMARAPHAHLIEFGHLMVSHNGKVLGHVAARPFLHTARDRVMLRFLSKWRDKA